MGREGQGPLRENIIFVLLAVVLSIKGGHKSHPFALSFLPSTGSMVNFISLQCTYFSLHPPLTVSARQFEKLKTEKEKNSKPNQICISASYISQVP